MSKKIFLDKLYEIKYKVKASLDKNQELRNYPTVQCCENMSSKSVESANVVKDIEALKYIDEIIETFINTPHP